MALSVTVSPSPPVSGGLITVNVNKGSEIVPAVVAVLDARLALQQATVDALNLAKSALLAI